MAARGTNTHQMKEHHGCVHIFCAWQDGIRPSGASASAFEVTGMCRLVLRGRLHEEGG